MADPTIFSYTLLDSNGIKATTRLYVQYNGATETVDALIGSWLAAGALFDDVTNAKITGGRIQIPVLPDGGWKAAPVDENDVSDVISLNFNNADNRYVFAVLVPAFKQALLTGGQVVIAGNDLETLIAHIVNGAGTVTYSNTQGRDLDGLNNAFQSDRKHRRATIAKSRRYA